MEIELGRINRPLLIVVQGAPAVGKTTVCETLKKRLIEAGYTVSYLAWDIFHHFNEPITTNKKHIISTTETMLSTAAKMISTVMPDIMIFDGVFAYEEENTTIASILPYVHSYICVTLLCQADEQIDRNLSRCDKDYLTPDRIHKVNNYLSRKSIKQSELMIDNTNLSITETTEKILSSINQDSNHVSETAKRHYTTIGTSPLWIIANEIRFGSCNIQKWGKFPFVVINENGSKIANALFYFDFGKIPSMKSRVLKLEEAGYSAIRFRYINQNSEALKHLEQFASEATWSLYKTAEWDAPLLSLPPNNMWREYLYRQEKRFKRTLKKIDKILQSQSMTFKENKNLLDTLELWLETINIDANSWKSAEKSDMMSLYREDLQYIFPLLLDQNNHSLFLTYINNKPAAYSLMARTDSKSQWYAVKWGCASFARRQVAGIICLLQHIEILYHEWKVKESEQFFQVDFWGRDNPIYNQLANKTVKRCHVELRSPM